MLKPVRNIFVPLLMILLMIAGCKKNNGLNENQIILFQVDYLNYAWGYQHQGFIIDNEGNVLKYDNPEGWNFPENDLSLTNKEVVENISRCTPTGILIKKEELEKYSSYIKSIAQSKVTAVKNSGADAGTIEYICYQFNENSGIYEGNLIKMEGDFTCENLNFYSKKVTLWLKDIRILATN